MIGIDAKFEMTLVRSVIVLSSALEDFRLRRSILEGANKRGSGKLSTTKHDKLKCIDILKQLTS